MLFFSPDLNQNIALPAEKASGGCGSFWLIKSGFQANVSTRLIPESPNPTANMPPQKPLRPMRIFVTAVGRSA
jgi:hypothetical protein